MIEPRRTQRTQRKLSRLKVPNSSVSSVSSVVNLSFSDLLRPVEHFYFGSCFFRHSVSFPTSFYRRERRDRRENILSSFSAHSPFSAVNSYSIFCQPSPAGETSPLPRLPCRIAA